MKIAEHQHRRLIKREYLLKGGSRGPRRVFAVRTALGQTMRRRPLVNRSARSKGGISRHGRDFIGSSVVFMCLDEQERVASLQQLLKDDTELVRDGHPSLLSV